MAKLRISYSKIVSTIGHDIMEIIYILTYVSDDCIVKGQFFPKKLCIIYVSDFFSTIIVWQRNTATRDQGRREET